MNSKEGKGEREREQIFDPGAAEMNLISQKHHWEKSQNPREERLCDAARKMGSQDCYFTRITKKHGDGVDEKEPRGQGQWMYQWPPTCRPMTENQMQPPWM